MAGDGPADALELKIISCKDLKCFNFFQKPFFYAVAALGSGDKAGRRRRRQQQRTPADGGGGPNPEWNHAVRFDLADVPGPERAALFVEFDLLAQAAVFGDRLAGRVCVPLSELLSGHGAGSVQYVMYQVRSPEGKPNGVLSFSYKVNTCSPTQELSKIESFPAQELLREESFSSETYARVESFSTEIYPKIEAFTPEKPPAAAEEGSALGYLPHPLLAPPPPPEPCFYPPPPAQPVGYYPPPAPAYYPFPEPSLGYPAPVCPYYAGYEGYGSGVYGFPTVGDGETWPKGYGNGRSEMCGRTTWGTKGLYPAVG